MSQPKFEESPVLSSKTTHILDLPPSCVEFCPAHPQYFVVGTYNLEKSDSEGPPTEEKGDLDEKDVTKNPQSRNGSLITFRKDGSQLQLVQTTLHPSAILDLHFQTINGYQDIFAVVSSTGTLSVFRLDPEGSPSEPVKHIATCRIDDIGEDVLFLSFAWHPTAPGILALTTSTGLVHLVHLDLDTFEIKLSQELPIENSLECWCVAIAVDMTLGDGQREISAMYSGGDDSALRYVSLAPSADEEDGTICDVLHAPITLKNQHGAGVTAILPLPLFLDGGSRIVLTGSYDDTLRVFAVQEPHRSFGVRRTTLLAEQNLGGGVWRLKPLGIGTMEDSVEGWRIKVLASCMHAGTRVVDISVTASGEVSIEVLWRFEEHQSMNYGSDCVADPGTGRFDVVSTSFYDRRLCLWAFDLS